MVGGVPWENQRCVQDWVPDLQTGVTVPGTRTRSREPGGSSCHQKIWHLHTWLPVPLTVLGLKLSSERPQSSVQCWFFGSGKSSWSPPCVHLWYMNQWIVGFILVEFHKLFSVYKLHVLVSQRKMHCNFPSCHSPRRWYFSCKLTGGSCHRICINGVYVLTTMWLNLPW